MYPFGTRHLKVAVTIRRWVIDRGSRRKISRKPRTSGILRDHTPAISVRRDEEMVRSLRRRKEVGHLHHFTKAIALDTLAICGYDIESFFFTESGFQPPDTSIKATIRDMPQRILFALYPDLAVRLIGGYSLLVKARPCSS